MDANLYERDFYAWANEQAALLRAGKLDAEDIEHIAAEIESMGKSEKRELVNRLVVLMLHLLKWEFQPALRDNSWRLSVRDQRYQLSDHLDDNPSLASRLDQVIPLAYRRAIIEAQRGTGLPSGTFPEDCPYGFGQMMDEHFWPGE